MAALAVQGLQLAPLQLPAELVELSAGATAANGELGGAPDRGAGGDARRAVHGDRRDPGRGAARCEGTAASARRARPGHRGRRHGRGAVEFELHGAELVDRLRIEGGRIDLSPARIAGSAALDARGVTLGRLQPWLVAPE